MWTVLEASSQTLESISLPGFVSEEEVYLRLWKMRFPRLRSLSLGIWHFDVPGAPDKFTEFVVAHGDTLEELDLAYGEYDEYAMDFDDSPFLEKDSLPRLKAFTGITSAFKHMVNTRMNCLQTSLEKLDIGPGGGDMPGYELKSLFDSILGPAQPKMIFRALRELRIDMMILEELPGNFSSITFKKRLNSVGRRLKFG
jgi:hypothetical protein